MSSKFLLSCHFFWRVLLVEKIPGEKSRTTDTWRRKDR